MPAVDAITVVAVVVAAVLGWVLGSRSGAARVRSAFDKAVAPDPGAGLSPLVKELRARLEGAWVPAGSEFQRAMKEAVDRIDGFMRSAVEDPLTKGLESGGNGMRDGVEQALAAVQDLHFYANDGIADGSARELVALVKQVNNEFRKDTGANIRGRLSKSDVSVLVDPEALMDALYLILHNANRFGGTSPIVVEVDQDGAFGKIKVVDGGEGFSAEALSRAYDPFYSTTPDGLGLGLPHARRLVQLMGGEIHIRNGNSGGGVVEISVPLA